MLKIIFFKVLVCSCLIILILPANASTREENIDKIIKAQGLAEMWSEQFGNEIKATQDEMMGFVDKMIAATPEQDSFSHECLRNSMLDMVNNELGLLIPTTEQLINIWKRYYASELSDNEVEQLAKLYDSDLIKKEITATKIATSKFSKALVEQRKSTADQRIANLLIQIRSLFENNSCRLIEPTEKTVQ